MAEQGGCCGQQIHVGHVDEPSVGGYSQECNGCGKIEFTKDCYVNRIVDRYMRTGRINMRNGVGMYADVTKLPLDYLKASEFVKRAENDFMRLNVNVRKRFNHNPQDLIDFLSDNKNRDEAVKLGLVKPSQEPPAQLAPQVGEIPQSKISK